MPHTACIFQLAFKCFVQQKELKLVCLDIGKLCVSDIALLISLLMCLSNSNMLSKHIPKSFSSVTEVSGTMVPYLFLNSSHSCIKLHLLRLKYVTI